MALIKYVSILIILYSCDNINENKPQLIFKERVLIYKNIENGRYNLTFNDDFKHNVSLGMYSLLKEGDTICFFRKDKLNIWYMNFCD